MSLDGIIYIFTPVHNRKKVTENFVRCLQNQVDQNFHLCLIDDGSTDGTADMVQSFLPNSTVLTGNGNLWWGGALQKGYEWFSTRNFTDQDLVLIINDDVVFGPLYLREGRNLLRRNPNSAVCSQYFDQETGDLLDRGARCDFKNYIISSAQSDEEVAFLSTRGLFLTAADFFKSKGFVPELLPHYLSDYEFTFRLRKLLGLHLITSNEIPVFGLNDQSGVPDLAVYGPVRALAIIFSKRFHGNPIHLSNFIRLCFPPQYTFRHIRRIWLRIPVLWSSSLPTLLFLTVRLIYSAIFFVIPNEFRRARQASRELAKRKSKWDVSKSGFEGPTFPPFYRFVAFPTLAMASQLVAPAAQAQPNEPTDVKIALTDLGKFLFAFSAVKPEKIWWLSSKTNLSIRTQYGIDSQFPLEVVGNFDQLPPVEKSLVVIDSKFYLHPQIKEQFTILAAKKISSLLILEFPLAEGSEDVIGVDAGEKTPAYLLSKMWTKNLLKDQFETAFEFFFDSKKFLIPGKTITCITGLYKAVEEKKGIQTKKI